jgi:hypothetical protein
MDFKLVIIIAFATFLISALITRSKNKEIDAKTSFMHSIIASGISFAFLSSTLSDSPEKILTEPF